jgi:hypothetical protein
MAAFFRGFLLFLFGALAGAAGILFLTPSFQVDVRRGDTAIKPLGLGTKIAQPTLVPAPLPAPVVAAPAAPAPVAVTPAPAPTKPLVTAVTPAPAPEPALDFAALSRHLILWPTAVTVKTPTTVSVKVEGQKPRDLTLEAGAVLQLARVLPTGQLEVRAKGEKFEIKSTLTDFAAELGKRVTELVAKGTKFDSPYPAAAAPAANPAPVAPPAPAASVVEVKPVVVAPKKPLTLAERIDVLYGRKPPEPETPVVPTSPAAPAPGAPGAAPAPMAGPAVSPASEPAPREAAKGEEKGKDLDRKMNQLFN